MVNREAMGESKTSKGLEALIQSGKYPLGLQSTMESAQIAKMGEVTTQ